MGRRGLILLLSLLPLACFGSSSASSGTGGGSEGTGGSGSGSGGTSATGGGTSGASTSSTASTTAASSGGSSSSTGPGSSSGASSGGGACAGTCVAAPEGWTGPVTLWEGLPSDPSPMCDGAFGDAGPGGLGDLDGGMASCGCTCADATLEGCDGTIRVNDHSPDSMCGELNPPGWDLTQGSCQFIAQGLRRLSMEDLTPTGGSCTPQPTDDIPPPAWGVQTKSCVAAAESTGCDADEWCAPAVAAPFGGTCVYKVGDQLCPAAYPNKRIRYDDYDDTRTCTGCTCGSPTGSCNAKVEMLDATCPIGASKGFVQPGDCPLTDSVDYLLATTDPSGTCEPSTPTLSGEVTGTGAVTFCCI